MTNIRIPLSAETRTGAATLFELDKVALEVENIAKSEEMDLAVLITYLKLNTDEQNKQLKLEAAKLRTLILQDIEKKLQAQLTQGRHAAEMTEQDKNKLKFWLLAIVGAFFFGCEGFDGIATVVGLTSVSGIVAFGVALLFSAIAVFVFCGFELKQIANHLGVKFKDASNLVNEYVKQLAEIEGLLDTVEKIMTEDSQIANNQLGEYQVMLEMLNKRLNHIKQEKEKLDEVKNAKKVKAIKLGFSLVAGAIFFSSGFFTGQAVALFIAGLFVTASATFPPILAAAVLLAGMSFLFYWFLQRPNMENLIGRKMGLDDEKLEKLGTDHTDKIEEKITSLQCRVLDKQEIVACQNQVASKSAEVKSLTADLTVSELSNAALKQELAEIKEKLSQSEENPARAKQKPDQGLMHEGKRLPEALTLIGKYNRALLFQPEPEQAATIRSLKMDLRGATLRESQA